MSSAFRVFPTATTLGSSCRISILSSVSSAGVVNGTGYYNSPSALRALSGERVLSLCESTGTSLFFFGCPLETTKRVRKKPCSRDWLPRP